MANTNNPTDLLIRYTLYFARSGVPVFIQKGNEWTVNPTYHFEGVDTTRAFSSQEEGARAIAQGSDIVREMAA